MTNGEIDDGSADIGHSARLFSVGQMVLAAFIGGPLAGALLLAQNYRVLGQKRNAMTSLTLGAFSLLVLMAIALVLPEDFPLAVLPVIYCIAFREVVRGLQGKEIAVSESAGQKGSWLAAVATGMAIMAGFLLTELLIG